MLGATDGLSVTEAVPDLPTSATLVAVTVTIWVPPTKEGAVYRPPEVTEPAPLGLMVHVTAVLFAPMTVAANCCVCEPNKLTLPGLTLTVTGVSATVAVAFWPPLVAVTVTVCAEETEEGAV